MALIAGGKGGEKRKEKGWKGSLVSLVPNHITTLKGEGEKK